MSNAKTSHVKSKAVELLVIVGVMAVSMGALLPAIQNTDRVTVTKRPVHKARHQSLISHRGITSPRAANM
jgi:hypothetical protein